MVISLAVDLLKINLQHTSCFKTYHTSYIVKLGSWSRQHFLQEKQRMKYGNSGLIWRYHETIAPANGDTAFSLVRLPL